MSMDLFTQRKQLVLFKEFTYKKQRPATARDVKWTWFIWSWTGGESSTQQCSCLNMKQTSGHLHWNFQLAKSVESLELETSEVHFMVNSTTYWYGNNIELEWINVINFHSRHMCIPQFHKRDVTLCFICEKAGKGLCRALMGCRIANTDQHFSNIRLLLLMHLWI